MIFNCIFNFILILGEWISATDVSDLLEKSQTQPDSNTGSILAVSDTSANKNENLTKKKLNVPHFV